MADTRVKIVDIQVRYQQAVEGMAKYRAALAEVKKYQKDLKKELADGKITREDYDKGMAASDVLMRQQGDTLRTLSKQVNNQVKAQQEQEGSLKQLRAELSNATTAYDAMSRAERQSSAGKELRDKINNITTELKAAEEETQRFYRNVGNYKSATEGLDTIKTKIMDIGKSMMLALGGGSMVAFSKDILQVTRDFQDGMARVQAVTDASEESMQMMEDKAREMGRTTIYHATEAAQAMENLVRGGLAAEEAVAALPKTLQLAQANTISLNDASDIMIRTLRGFELPITPESMEHANDVLSKTSSTSTTNVLELSEALKNAAPFGHALNQSLEEVNAALGVLADVGVRGADAGTALRMVILGLSSPTAKQQKVFKEYGIEINQASLESEGLTKTLQRLKDSGIMDASNSAKLLSDVFGRRCTPQVMALVGNIDRLQDKLETLSEAQGTTERMFDQSYSNVSKSVFALQSAWEDFKISIGESSNGALLEPIDAMTAGVRFLSTHIGELGRFILSLIASISFLKLVSHAKASFATIRDSAVQNAESASTQVRTLQNQEIVLRKTTASQTVAIEKATGTERMMLEAKLLANKRELAETEKALAKAKINEITLWEKAAAVNSGVAWKSAMASATIAMEGFFTSAKMMARTFILTALFQLAFDALYGLINLMSNATKGDGVFAKLTSAVTGFIKNGINWLITQVKAVISWFKEFVENSRIAQVWLVSFKTQLQTIGAVFKTVWTIFKTGIKQIWNAFKGLISIIGGVATALEGLFSLNWDQIKRGIKQVGNAVIDFGKDTISNAKNAKDEIVQNAKDAYNGVADAFNSAKNSKAFGGSGSSAQNGSPTSETKGTTPDEAVADAAESEGDKPKTTYAEDARKAKQDWEDAKKEYQRIIKDQNATSEEVLAARQAMADAQKSYEDLTGNKSSSGGSGSGKSGKEDNTAKKQAELERKAFEEAEQAMLDLMKDTAAKRRAQLEKQYDDEIRKLKVRLATEKNLTEEAKEAIRQTIILKEQKKNEELAKLDDEELKRDIQNRQALINSRLEIAKKGSEYELNLKKQKNEEQLKLDEMALEEEREIAMEDSRQRLENAIAAYGAESEAATEARLRLLEIESDYEDRLINMQEATRQKNLELEEQYQQQLLANRQQAFQNQVTEMEIQNQEWQLKQQEDIDLYLDQQMGAELLNLQVVTQGEMDILAAKRQAAEERYNDIVAAGQLENETLEAYNARVLAAEKNKYDAQKAYMDADVKNRKAYLTSMRTLSNSIISLASAIGEENEAMVRLSEILTLAQIAIDTGRALSAGIASASALPFPANMAAIATTVATIIANIATAISTVKSANSTIESLNSDDSTSTYAEGGKVHGPGTGTSDSIQARLSNGEYVMTAKATNMFEPLLAAMNAIGAGVVPMSVTNGYREAPIYAEELRDSFTDSFKEAAKEIHPVVSVVEITEAQDQVRVIESLDTL